MSDIVLLHLVGIHVVVVHGGGPEDQRDAGQGGPSSPNLWTACATPTTRPWTSSSRCLRPGEQEPCTTLNRMGSKAVGPSGMDDSLFQAVKKDSRYGLVGTIKEVNPDPVVFALENDYIPVVSTVAMAWTERPATTSTPTPPPPSWPWPSRRKAHPAHRCARHPARPQAMKTPHPCGAYARGGHLIEEGIISGGMIPKLSAAWTASAAAFPVLTFSTAGCPTPSSSSCCPIRASVRCCFLSQKCKHF